MRKVEEMEQSAHIFYAALGNIDDIITSSSFHDSKQPRRQAAVTVCSTMRTGEEPVPARLESVSTLNCSCSAVSRSSGQGPTSPSPGCSPQLEGRTTAVECLTQRWLTDHHGGRKQTCFGTGAVRRRLEGERKEALLALSGGDQGSGATERRRAGLPGRSLVLLISRGDAAELQHRLLHDSLHRPQVRQNTYILNPKSVSPMAASCLLLVMQLQSTTFSTIHIGPKRCCTARPLCLMRDREPVYIGAWKQPVHKG